MAFLAALDWPLRIVLGVVVAGALGTGIVLAVRTSGGDDAQVAGQLTGTPPTLVPSTTSGPPTPGLTVTAPPTTQTQPAPTQPPATEPPATSVPTLPPPPPKPENPALVTSESLPGGEWYRLQLPLRGEMICVDFYLPAGRTFVITAPLNDPGGVVSLVIRVAGTNSGVWFNIETMAELERVGESPDLTAVIAQVADTAAFC